MYAIVCSACVYTCTCTCILFCCVILVVYVHVHVYITCIHSLRLEGVEVRLQETSEAFEQSRTVAKKSKLEYERVKKMRYDMCFHRVSSRFRDGNQLIHNDLTHTANSILPHAA